MSKAWILAGSIDQTIDVFVPDSSSTVGAGLAALVYNSPSLACYYRKGATGSATQLTLATQTVGGAHSDGGFVEISSSNMKGLYRLDLSDTMVATAGITKIYLYGATNMAPVVAEVEVVSVNIYDAVRMGLTALPNAAAEAAGGLYTRGTGAGQIKQTNNGEIDANATHVNNVATTSVTAVNANQGTTQPLNFTGTGASALVKSDTVDIAGSAVSASSAQIGVNVVNWGGGAVPAPNVTGVPLVDAKYLLGTIFATPNTAGIPKVDPTLWLGGTIATPNVTGVPKVDITHFKGTASAGTAGYAGIDWSAINAPTSTVALTNTTISSTQTPPSVASIATAIWSDVVSYGVGTKGALLVAAGAAGDPWNTNLPGTYVAGTAGYLLAVTMAGQLARSIGLNGENSVLQDVVYDAYGNVLSGTVRLYDSAANATTNNGVTGLIAEYDIANTIAANVLSESLQTRTA